MKNPLLLKQETLRVVAQGDDAGNVILSPAGVMDPVLLKQETLRVAQGDELSPG